MVETIGGVVYNTDVSELVFKYEHNFWKNTRVVGAFYKTPEGKYFQVIQSYSPLSTTEYIYPCHKSYVDNIIASCGDRNDLKFIAQINQTVDKLNSTSPPWASTEPSRPVFLSDTVAASTPYTPIALMLRKGRTDICSEKLTETVAKAISYATKDPLAHNLLRGFIDGANVKKGVE